MNDKELNKQIELFYNASKAYRDQHANWFGEVEKVLEGTDTTNIYSQLSRVYNEKNARYTDTRGARVGSRELIKRYKERMTKNLSRFQASFSRSLITAASAARGGVSEQYIHNIAGDTQAGDYATEVLNDIITNDRTLKKLPRFAGEIFKYNSAVLVVDEYGVKGDVFKFRTKLYSGKHVLYDPQSDEEDIQTSRFIGMDGFKYTKDILERMKMDKMAKSKGYITKGIDEMISKIAGSTDAEHDDEHETEVEMVQMYIYDEEENSVHHVIFDQVDKTIVKHTEEKNIIAGGREVRFNVVGGVRNIDGEAGHYSKSDFYAQMPMLKSRVTMVIDILSTVSQLRSNVTLVHPNAFKDVLKAFVDGFPIAQSSEASSSAVPIQNQLTTLDQPNLNGLQNVLNQFETMFERMFPENTPELRGAVEEKLKSVYEGNLSVIRKIIEANSPLENALRDLFMIIVRTLVTNPSQEFLIRSTSVGAFPLNKILASKLLKPKKGKMTTVAIDIRAVLGDQSDFIARKELMGQLTASAQAGGVNIRNLSEWMVRNGDKVKARFTADDRYIIFSAYDEVVVRQVLNDIKMAAVGENIVYPDNIVGTDYMNVLQDCLKKKAHSYIGSNGKFTKEGDRVYKFAVGMLEKYANSRAENGQEFQKREVETLEAEERFRSPQEGNSEAVKGIFANQKTFAEQGA